MKRVCTGTIIFAVVFAMTLMILPTSGYCAEQKYDLSAGTTVYQKAHGKTVKKTLKHPVVVTVIEEKETLSLVLLPDGGKWWIKKSSLTSPYVAEAKPADALDTATPSESPSHVADVPPDKGDTVIALDITSEFIDPDDLKKVNTAARTALREQWGSAVIDQNEVAKWMEFGEESKRLNCFQNQQCIMEVSRKVNSNRIFGGVMGMVGKKPIFNLYIMDGKSGSAIARVSQEASGTDDLEAAVSTAVRALIKKIDGVEKSIAIDMTQLGNHPKIAIMDFQASGVDANLSRNISDVVAAELKQFKQLQIIGRQEIAAMLKFEETRQGMGCEDDRCFVEIGNALGVGFLVVGNIGLVADTYILGIKVINMRKTEIIGREQEQFKGPAEELLPAARFAVRRLFGVPYEGEGLLKLTVSEEEAKVNMGETELGLYPKLKIPEVLQAGKYRITVEKEDFYPISRDIYVEPARQTQAQFVMEELPPKWYKTWWFWTIIGTVVAGGITTGVVLGTMEASGPNSGSGVATLR